MNLNLRSETQEKDTTEDCVHSLVKELVILLKAAQRASNKLREQMIKHSHCGHIHDDFEYLRRLLKRALFPCLHRIKRNHLPSLGVKGHFPA